MTAREGALGFGTTSRRPWGARSVNDQSHCTHRKPASDGRGGNGRSAAVAPESPGKSERRGHVAAGQPEELERPLGHFQAAVVAPLSPVIERVIERRRLVEGRDGAERNQSRKRRAGRRWPHNPRRWLSRGPHARAKLQDACYCQI